MANIEKILREQNKYTKNKITEQLKREDKEKIQTTNSGSPTLKLGVPEREKKQNGGKIQGNFPKKDRYHKYPNI